ncbi:MAG: RNA-binding transcriptional accessory protein [Deltaproteobacteria bacterium]|nr:RNA-binding transcriptional accessory protein [Deltaproteobacteria bacterium]
MQADAKAFDPLPRLALELDLPARRISAVLDLLQAGNTVPFIARYRKEATGELDEVQIRSIQERCAYLAELEERRQRILASLEAQGVLDDALAERVLSASTKSELEDLYLPYRPKRRTRAAIARERGLEPLAKRILAQPPDGSPETEAQRFVDPDKGVEDGAAALSGARDIAAEHMSERAECRALVREAFFRSGRLRVEVRPDKREAKTKFQQYYDYAEAIARIPSHRFLAIRRGEREEVLHSRLEADDAEILDKLLGLCGHAPASPWSEQLGLAVEDGYRRLLHPSVGNDVLAELKQRSDAAAVEIFAQNLRDLLMAAPLGARPVIGIDPGLRTGCKCIAVDGTGKVCEHATLQLSHGEKAKQAAREVLLAMIARQRPSALAIGNGTGGRESESQIRAWLAEAGLAADLVLVMIDESGASVYSASDLARAEMPDLDVTLRGAASIARRLQDPLAELVKIEPRAIGVGQYQHDVHQPLLARKLDEVVESCVNSVGVELNTASAPLLARVAGIGPATARRIVSHRDAHGAFRSRAQLLDVSGLGPKTFEQAAGFLRVRDGEHALDASAVHPERYALVERMASDLGISLAALVGNGEAAGRIDIQRYVSKDVGEPTLRDITAELAKPGRDPRADFEPPRFREDVCKIEDLELGMQLEGVVTNVTHFGAFVDIGVHRDGLVHISELADTFVSDPRAAVRVGARLRVRVVEVDIERNRISLSARQEPAAGRGPGPRKQRRAGEKNRPRRSEPRREATPKKRPDGGLTHNPFAGLVQKRKD